MRSLKYSKYFLGIILLLFISIDFSNGNSHKDVNSREEDPCHKCMKQKRFPTTQPSFVPERNNSACWTHWNKVQEHCPICQIPEALNNQFNQYLENLRYTVYQSALNEQDSNSPRFINLIYEYGQVAKLLRKEKDVDMAKKIELKRKRNIQIHDLNQKRKKAYAFINIITLEQCLLENEIPEAIQEYMNLASELAMADDYEEAKTIAEQYLSKCKPLILNFNRDKAFKVQEEMSFDGTKTSGELINEQTNALAEIQNYMTYASKISEFSHVEKAAALKQSVFQAYHTAVVQAFQNEVEDIYYSAYELEKRNYNLTTLLKEKVQNEAETLDLHSATANELQVQYTSHIKLVEKLNQKCEDANSYLKKSSLMKLELCVSVDKMIRESKRSFESFVQYQNNNIELPRLTEAFFKAKQMALENFHQEKEWLFKQVNAAQLKPKRPSKEIIEKVEKLENLLEISRKELFQVKVLCSKISNKKCVMVKEEFAIIDEEIKAFQSMKKQIMLSRWQVYWKKLVKFLSFNWLWSKIES